MGQGGDSPSSQGLTLQGALQIPFVHWALWVPPHASSFELTNLECAIPPPSQACVRARTLFLRLGDLPRYSAPLALAQFSLLWELPSLPPTEPGPGEGASGGFPSTAPAHRVLISLGHVTWV